MDQLLQTWNALDLRRRIILVLAVAATLAAVLALARVATKPGMALLYSGLDPSAAGEVVGALEQMGVESEIRGDAIYVPEDARDRVRLSLARDGLPRQGPVGYELLDGLSGFNATSDMFDAAYWRAKEGELARSILASPGVRSARVHLAVGSRRPFARSAAQPTASVTVTMGGGGLTSAQATAIRYMVALAVADLSPDQVAVIDSRNGVVLAPGSETPMASALTEAAEREAKIKAEIEDLLAARVGRDKARVSVTVETDLEGETLTERIVQPDSRVTLHSDTEEIRDSSTGTEPGVTIASELPEGAAGEGGASTAERTETRERLNYDYSELLRETVRAPGAIKRISVAVLVDGIVTEDASGEPVWAERPAEELEALRELVVAAVGFDEARGDIVTVDSMQFQPDAMPGTEAEANGIMQFLERNAMTLIQIGVLSLVALILAFTVIRPMLSRRSREDEAALMGELLGADAEVPGGAGAGAGDEGATELLEPQPTITESLRLTVAEQTDETVALLQEWLEGDGEAAEEEAA